VHRESGEGKDVEWSEALTPIPIPNLIAIAIVCAAFAFIAWLLLRESEPRNDPPPFYTELLTKERCRAQAAWGQTFKARAENARLGMRIHNQRKRIAELMEQLATPKPESPSEDAKP